MKRCLALCAAVILIEDNSVVVNTVQKKAIYRIVIWILLFFSVYILITLAPTLSQSKYLPSDDFVPYWAGGKLNLVGENPYDAQKKESVQIAAGGEPSSKYPIAIMLSPPWALPIVMPLSALDYPLSRLIWLLISIACLVICAQLLWRFNKGSPQKLWIALVAILIFGPTISVLESGQFTPLILLGITGFLFFTISHQNDWVAGACLALATIKPQVAFIFWIALLFWVIKECRWKIIISCFVTILLMTLIAMAFNHHIIQQYLGMMENSYIPQLATPTIGAYIRFFWLGIDKFWLQFVPAIFAGLWFLVYWKKHGNSWVWLYELPILLFVSQISAPYTYTYDQVILMPAIILAIIWLVAAKLRWSTIIFACVFIGITILDLILHMRLDDFWFIWMAPTLFIWFLLIRRQYSISEINSWR